MGIEDFGEAEDIALRISKSEGGFVRITLTAFFLISILVVFPFQLSRASNAAAKRNTVYLFIEVETKVYRKGVEISSEHPEERRWYMSNVVVQPEDVPTYSLIKQKVMPYFSRNVMDPFEARGFSLDYGEQDVKLNGDVSYANYATRAEAEDQRTKEI